MPKRTDLKTILIIGAGPIVIGQACEFDYSGAQACKALREEGYRVILVNSNPATIMTDPEMADVHLHRADHLEVVEKIIAKERPDAVLPTMGGQTALNCALDLHRHGVLQKYGVEMIGANEKAIEKAEDRLKFKDAMTGIGLHSAKSGIAHSMDEALAVQRRITHEIGGNGFPMVIRPSFTLGGTGGGIAYNPDEFEEICKRGLDLSPTKELLIEESADRLEGVRDGGGARQGGQLHHRLLDREPRPDGHPHRRLDHGGAGADAVGQGIPADAQRLDRDPARDRRRDRRLERAVRGQSEGRPDGRHRDEPARLALLGAGLEGDRLSDRQGRGQARRRLHARRAEERHHRRRDAGELRALDRLRRHQDPALRLREVPRRRLAPDDADEVGGRGDGDGPHLPGEPAEGAARPRDRHRRPLGAQQRPRGDRPGDRRGRPGAAALRRRRVPHRHERGRDLRGDGDRPVVPGADRGDRRRREGARRPQPGEPVDRRDALPEGQGLLRPPPGPPARQPRGRGALAAPRPGRAPGLQAGRHLRRRVRDPDRLHVLDLRRGVRGRADRPEEDHGPRRRAEPHRPGHRVRLLLRPRRPRHARGRLRDHHGQLQPRDRVDRLRHLGPPLLRAGDARGRARDRRQGKAGRRDRPVRRADAAQARARAGEGGRADRRHLARFDRHRRGPRALPEAAPRARPEAAAQPHRAHRGAGAGPGAGDRLSAGGAAELRARRPGDGDRPRRQGPRALHARGGQGEREVAGPARPLPRRRDRGRRRLHQRRPAR